MKKVFHIWNIFLLLNQGFLNVSCYGLPEEKFSMRTTEREMQVEERSGGMKFQAASKLKDLIKSEDFKGGIPDVISNAGGITSLAKMDYNRPPLEVLKDVGDAVIPIITTGLALIPGGALIGGIVSGVWGLLSPFFGGEQQKSPMEKMIDNIVDEIDTIKKHLNKLSTELPAQIMKKVHEKLSSIVHRAIQGEISRNDYVCSKYALISREFSDDLKNNLPVNESLRIEMIALLNDCDNFLKDTAEAFVYDEFADVLWVPAVMTTLVRVAFLAEVSNYGMSLKIDAAIINSFWFELEQDLMRVFRYVDQGVKGRLEGWSGKDFVNDPTNFTAVEYEGCKMQAQLLYFHRKVYPYGVPKHVRVTQEQKADVKIADYVNSTRNDPQHMQIYFNDLNAPDKSDESEGNENLLNCIMGESIHSSVPTETISFRVVYIPNKSYELRLLYFIATTIYTKDEVKYADFVETATKGLDRNVAATQEGENTIKLTIKPGDPNTNSGQRFKFQTGYHQLYCLDLFKGYQECNAKQKGVSGFYVVEDILVFNVLPGDELKGTIKIVNVDNEVVETEETPMMGVELIVLPMIS